MKFKIYRYNPETDAKPYVQEYELDNVEPGTMLLAALLRIKDEQDQTPAILLPQKTVHCRQLPYVPD